MLAQGPVGRLHILPLLFEREHVVGPELPAHISRQRDRPVAVDAGSRHRLFGSNHLGSAVWALVHDQVIERYGFVRRGIARIGGIRSALFRELRNRLVLFGLVLRCKIIQLRIKVGAAVIAVQFTGLRVKK